MKEKVVIIGASSGIGYALAKLLVKEGHEVGLAARRLEKLNEVKSLSPDTISICKLDVQAFDQIEKTLDGLIEQLGGMDWIVYVSGIGLNDKDLDPQRILPMVLTNAAGFTAVFGYAVKRMKKSGHGLIAGVSSVMEARGSSNFATYSATKAFMSRFMEGARRRTLKWNINVCDIRPGFIKTAMTETNPNTFLMVDADTAARDIYKALRKKKAVAYIPCWWAPIAAFIRMAPKWIVKKMGY